MYTRSYDPKTVTDKLADAARKRVLDDAADDWPECLRCGEPFAPARKALGHNFCLRHGDAKRTFTVVPVPKSNYVIATSAAQVASPYSHKGNR